MDHTESLRALMRAAALIAARRCSSSLMRFCVQNLAISRFVTLSTTLLFLAKNLGSGGGGGGGDDGELTCFLLTQHFPPVSCSICFIFINFFGQQNQWFSQFRQVTSVAINTEEETKRFKSSDLNLILRPTPPQLATAPTWRSNMTYRLGLQPHCILQSVIL